MQPSQAESLTADEFAQWVCQADPDESVVYYTGHLAEDRMTLTYVTNNGVQSKAYLTSDPADTIGREAWDAYCNGFVELTQRRWGDKFKYIATRRHG